MEKDTSSKIADLKEHVKEYVQTRVELLTLTAADKGTAAVSNAVLYFALFLISIFFLLFLSVGAAFAISEALDVRYSGFLIVAGFYLLLGVILFVLQNKLVKDPIVNTLLKSFFGKKETGHEKH